VRDFAYLAVTVLFFVMAVAYLRGCERLK